MLAKRRASPEELAQGQKEMEEAQKRLEKGIAQPEELQLEDARGPEVPESFASPKKIREDQEGREEKPVVTPKTLQPLGCPMCPPLLQVHRTLRWLCNQLCKRHQVRRGHLLQQ